MLKSGILFGTFIGLIASFAHVAAGILTYGIFWHMLGKIQS